MEIVSPPTGAQRDREAFFMTMSEDWRRKTGYAPRFPQDAQSHDISPGDRTREFADAQKELRYVMAGSVAEATPESTRIAAEIVTRDRPVDVRHLADSMSKVENQGKGRGNAALAASMALRGLGR